MSIRVARVAGTGSDVQVYGNVGGVFQQKNVNNPSQENSDEPA